MRNELGTPLGTARPSAPRITATLPAAPTGRAEIFPVLSPSELTVLVRARAPSPPRPRPRARPMGSCFRAPPTQSASQTDSGRLSGNWGKCGAACGLGGGGEERGMYNCVFSFLTY